MAAAEGAGASALPDEAEQKRADLGAEAFMSVVDQVGKEMRPVAPKFPKKAWLFLPDDAFPRKQVIKIVEHPFFDSFILFLIAANCVTMLVFNEPVLSRMIEFEPDTFATTSSWAASDRNVNLFKPVGGCSVNGPGPCSVSQWIDWVFLVIFAVEMVLKMLASGLMLHPNAYLRSGWNWLDFIVVVVGFVEMYSTGLPGISTLRLVKTLRPLRSLQRIRGMRVLVSCILEAMPQMCRVLVFLFFIIWFFALIGVALFKSGLRYTCHVQADDGSWESTDAICRPHCNWSEKTFELEGACESLGANTMQRENFDSILTWDWVYTCRSGQQCLCNYNQLPDPTCDHRANPNHGITSFDSIPWAIISLFQAISLEGWVDMMYQLQDGVSSWVWTYFVALVLFGAIIVINLFLAVLCDNFEMADSADEGTEDEEEEGQKVVLQEMKALVHKNPLRQAVLVLIRHRYFEWFVQACIVLNTVIMCTRFSPQPGDRRYYSLPGEQASTDYMPAALFWFQFWMNIILTVIFSLESLLKIVGLGPRLFMKDHMNIFDFVVVAISIFEICIDPKVSQSDSLASAMPLPISVLRAFRIFRLFKLVRSVPSLRKILATLAQSMASVVYLAMLLLLMILIFLLLGMELFGGYYPRPELNYTSTDFPSIWASDDKGPRWEDEASRYHFDDPGNACLAIFVVLSGENWNEIMFHTHEATWDANTNSALPIPYAIPYFIALFFIGNLLLFNLFIAILLSNFDDDEEEEEEEGDEVLDEGAAAAGGQVTKLDKQEATMEWKFNGYMMTKSSADLGAAAKAEPSTSTTRKSGAAGDDEDEPAEKPMEKFPKAASGDETGGDKSLMIFGWDSPVRIFFAQLVTHPWFEAFIVTLILVSTALMLLDFPTLPESHWSRKAISQCDMIFAIIFTIEMCCKWVATGVVKSKTPKGYLLSDAYFRGESAGWNVLDFVIVIISLVVLTGVEAVRPLRSFRAFRPLRLVQRYEDLKITVATLFQSVPAMGSLISVAALFFLIFAILGVELYGGKLGYCVDPDYEGEPYGSRVVPGINPAIVNQWGEPQNDYEECMALSRYNISRRTTHGILFSDMAQMFPDENWLEFAEFPQWFNPGYGHFDNLALSLLLLFEISALEGWPDVMHNCMDSDQNTLYVTPWKIAHYQDRGGCGSTTLCAGGECGCGGVDAPMQEHMPQSFITAVFFMCWIIIGCFVVVNMTVGVVVDTFAQIKAENDGVLLMSEEAADWVKAQKQVFAQRPLKQAAPPKEPWRLNVYYLVTSTKFEVTIMIIILLNVLQMGLNFWEPRKHEYDTGEPGGALGDPNSEFITTWYWIMFAMNLIFLVIYIFEMLIKWVGLGIKQYFKNPADCFDFVLVAISVIEAVLSLLPTKGIPIGLLRVLRLFRVIRILRVIKSAKQLRAIIMTVYISVPQLKNILVLIMLLIVITDVLCLNIFAYVNYTPGNFDWTADHAESISRGEVMPDPDNNYYFSGDGTNWGDMINRHANFQYFWTGMITLVRSSTGESFNLIMHDLKGYTWGNNRLKCCAECGPMLGTATRTYHVSLDANGKWAYDPSAAVEMVIPESSCGSDAWSLVIYLIFQNSMAYVVLSIMIGVILENFTQVGSETRKIRVDDLEEFREVWLKYDPKGTFIVPSHNLLAILQQLREPLGIAGAQPALTRAEMLKHLGKLDIPDHGGYIHFTETLTAVCNFIGGVPVPVCDTTKKMQKAAQQVPKIKVLDKPAHNALTNYLVSLLQSRWRGYAMRKKHDEGGDAGAPAGFAPPAAVKKSQVAPQPADAP